MLDGVLFAMKQPGRLSAWLVVAAATEVDVASQPVSAGHLALSSAVQLAVMVICTAASYYPQLDIEPAQVANQLCYIQRLTSYTITTLD